MLERFLCGGTLSIIEILRKWAEEKKIFGNDEVLLKNKEIKRMVLEELKKDGQKVKFTSLELIKNIYLEKDSFANKDLLTTTFKMKRNEAKKLYEVKINEMYKEGTLL